MILMHVAYGLDLIALTTGTALLVWSMKNPGKGSWLGKLFGAIVMILAIISIVCIYSCAFGVGCHKGAMGEEGAMMGTSTAATAAPEHSGKKEHRR